MSARCVLLLLAASGASLAQRGSYAGRRPIGYPAIITTTTSAPLDNRFGEDGTTTTIRLPIEALGDRDLVERLSKLPIEKQPFWLLNWQALEENRKRPQSYEPNPISFVGTFSKQNTQNRVMNTIPNRSGTSGQFYPQMGIQSTNDQIDSLGNSQWFVQSTQTIGSSDKNSARFQGIDPRNNVPFVPQENEMDSTNDFVSLNPSTQKVLGNTRTRNV